jgi:photosystem II stability/assembly factor-like uncharacterized protein
MQANGAMRTPTQRLTSALASCRWQRLRRIQSIWPLLAVVGILAIGGCGGNDGPDAASPPTATPLPDGLVLSIPPYAEADAEVAMSSSTDSGQAGLTYSWDFGNGNVSSTAQVAPQRFSPGRYVVRLTVRNEAGASRSASAQLLVGPQEAPARGLGCTRTDARGWCQMSANVTSMHFRTPLSGWATDDGGLMLSTKDGGVSWQAHPTGTTWSLSSPRFADEDRGWVLGSSDEGAARPKPRILRTTDGGTRWVAQDLKLDEASAALTLTIVDAERAIVHTAPLAKSYLATLWPTLVQTARVTLDGGATWSASPYPPAAMMPSVRMWAISSTGSLLVSDDLGLTTRRELTLGGRVESVHFADEGIGAAVANPLDSTNAKQPLIYRTTDGGETWTATAAQGLPADAYGDARIVVSDRKVTWLTLYRRTARLFRSTDGGERWDEVPLPENHGPFDNETGILPISATSAWFLDGASAAVYLLPNVGTPWLGLVPPSSRPVGFVAAGESMFVGTLDTAGRRHWFRTTDLGQAWVSAFHPPLRSTWSPSDAVGSSHFFDASHWLASMGTELHETFDGGRTWAIKLERAPPSLYGNQGASRLQFTTPQDGWVLLGNVLHRTSDSGATWTPIGGPPMSGPFAIMNSDFDFRADGRGVIVVDAGPLVPLSSGDMVPAAGGVALSTPQGPWTDMVKLDFTPKSVRWASSAVAVVVGAGGRITRSEDGGKTWSERPSGVTKDLQRLLFRSDGDGWAVGEGGTMLRSTDAGLSWKLVPVPTTARLNDIVFADALNGYSIGDAGTVLATSDGGTTWVLQPTGTQQDLVAIAVPLPGVVRMLSRDGRVFTSSTGGY